MTWRAPVLPAAEQVAIAVGNQLRIANARFDAAAQRLKPKTLFQQLMQDLDDLETNFERFGQAAAAAAVAMDNLLAALKRKDRP